MAGKVEREIPEGEGAQHELAVALLGIQLVRVRAELSRVPDALKVLRVREPVEQLDIRAYSIQQYKTSRRTVKRTINKREMNMFGQITDTSSTSCL